MIKHIVFWNIKEAADGLDRDGIAQKMKTDLEALVGRIPSIRALEVGINEKPSPQACDVCLVSAFEDWTGLEAYMNHPDHLQIVGFIRSVVTARHVVDYEIP